MTKDIQSVMALKVIAIVVLAAAVLTGLAMRQTVDQPRNSFTPKVAPAAFNSEDVAGDYYFGDGLGVNCSLKLTSKGTFDFTWHGCMGVYDQNSGSFTCEGDEVILSPTKPNRRDGFRGTATRFFPVKWGKRLYLVAEEQMLGFCGRVQAHWDGTEVLGRSGYYYLRDATKLAQARDLKAVNGKPEVPDRFKPFLTGPYQAKIVKLLDKGRALIDKGSNDNMLPETKLSPAADRWRWLHVVKIGASTSEVELWDKKDKMPKVGSICFPYGI